MNGVNTWSTLICCASIACILVEFLLPPGKVSKVMNMIIGVFMLSVIITPLAEGKNMFKFDFDKIKNDSNLESKFDFLNKVNSQMENLIEDNMIGIVSGVLKDSGIPFKKIEIFMDKNQDNNISINKCKVYIDQNDENLKEKIKNEVEGKLKIKTEVANTMKEAQD